MEPGDYQDAPVSKILRFIQPEMEVDAQQILKGDDACANLRPTPYAFIHSLIHLTRALSGPRTTFNIME
jgi:hypothetical protein